MCVCSSSHSVSKNTSGQKKLPTEWELQTIVSTHVAGQAEFRSSGNITLASLFPPRCLSTSQFTPLQLLWLCLPLLLPSVSCIPRLGNHEQTHIYPQRAPQETRGAIPAKISMVSIGFPGLITAVWVRGYFQEHHNWKGAASLKSKSEEDSWKPHLWNSLLKWLAAPWKRLLLSWRTVYYVYQFRGCFFFYFYFETSCNGWSRLSTWLNLDSPRTQVSGDIAKELSRWGYLLGTPWGMV